VAFLCRCLSCRVPFGDQGTSSVWVLVGESVPLAGWFAWSRGVKASFSLPVLEDGWFHG
jgi:hypothetical protein